MQNVFWFSRQRLAVSSERGTVLPIHFTLRLYYAYYRQYAPAPFARSMYTPCRSSFQTSLHYITFCSRTPDRHRKQFSPLWYPDQHPSHPRPLVFCLFAGPDFRIRLQYEILCTEKRLSHYLVTCHRRCPCLCTRDCMRMIYLARSAWYPDTVFVALTVWRSYLGNWSGRHSRYCQRDGTAEKVTSSPRGRKSLQWWYGARTLSNSPRTDSYRVFSS